MFLTVVVISFIITGAVLRFRFTGKVCSGDEIRRAELGQNSEIGEPPY